MAIENPPFRIRRGDDRVLQIPVQNADGSLADVSQKLVRWTYGPRQNGEPYVVKDQTSPDMIRGVGFVQILFGRTETLSLKAGALLYCQLLVDFTAGPVAAHETVGTGSFTVDPSQD
jgi:hypothetical protein